VIFVHIIIQLQRFRPCDGFAHNGKLFKKNIKILRTGKPLNYRLHTQTFIPHFNQSTTKMSMMAQHIFNFCIFLLLQSAFSVASPKNILVILTDDQGLNDVGYNNPEFNTPTIDAL